MTWQRFGEVAARVADQATVVRREYGRSVFMAGVVVGITAACRGSRSPATLAVLEAIADGHDWTALLDQSALPAIARRRILSTANGVALGTRIVRARRNTELVG